MQCLWFLSFTKKKKERTREGYGFTLQTYTKWLNVHA